MSDCPIESPCGRHQSWWGSPQSRLTCLEASGLIVNRGLSIAGRCSRRHLVPSSAYKPSRNLAFRDVPRRSQLLLHPLLPPRASKRTQPESLQQPKIHDSLDVAGETAHELSHSRLHHSAGSSWRSSISYLPYAPAQRPVLGCLHFACRSRENLESTGCGMDSLVRNHCSFARSRTRDLWDEVSVSLPMSPQCAHWP